MGAPVAAVGEQDARRRDAQYDPKRQSDQGEVAYDQRIERLGIGVRREGNERQKETRDDHRHPGAQLSQKGLGRKQQPFRPSATLQMALTATA
jgi:hypothetical protein